MLNHDMSDSVPLKVVEVFWCGSADVWDRGVDGGPVVYSPCDGAEGRVDLNVGRADGFNRNVEGIHRCEMQFWWMTRCSLRLVVGRGWRGGLGAAMVTVVALSTLVGRISRVFTQCNVGRGRKSSYSNCLAGSSHRVRQPCQGWSQYRPVHHAALVTCNARKRSSRIA